MRKKKKNGFCQNEYYVISRGSSDVRAYYSYYYWNRRNILLMMRFNDVLFCDANLLVRIFPGRSRRGGIMAKTRGRYACRYGDFPQDKRRSY